MDLPPDAKAEFADQPTRCRYRVTAMLAVAAALAYVCRNSLVVAEKTIRQDLGLSEEQMGWILGPVFFWSYALAQLPGGWMAQRFGSRRCLPLWAGGWSLAMGWFAVAQGFWVLLISRLTMGLAQAGLFPGSVHTICQWHPNTARATNSGVLAASMSVGGAIGAAATGYLMGWIGWRWAFALFAIPGLVWAVVFYVWFRERPAQHAEVNDAERRLIDAGRAKSPPDDPFQSSGKQVAWRLLTSRTLALICGQQFFRAAGYAFFASWFATYMQETRNVNTAHSGLLTTLPLLATVAASLMGGGFSDWILHRTGSLAWARQGVATTSLLLCGLLVLAAYWIHHPLWASLIISGGIFCAGFAGPCAYAITMDVGGRQVAAVFSTMNMIGNFGAGLLPWLVPRVKYFVEHDAALFRFFDQNSWNAILVLFAAMYFAAALCWFAMNTERAVFDDA